MIKYEYRVLKPFTVLKDESGKSSFTQKMDERNGGSSFYITNGYVDYAFPHRQITQCTVTETLIQKGYISLVREIKKGNDK